MRNLGKVFESEVKTDFEKIDNLFYQRLKDDTMKHKGVGNICDCIIFYNKILFLLELKSTKQKSLPLVNIKQKQIEGLTKETINNKDIYGGFLIKYYKVDKENKKKIKSQEVYYISIQDFNKYFIENPNRKSLPVDYVREKGILVNQTLKRVKYTYDLEKMLKDISNKI